LFWPTGTFSLTTRLEAFLIGLLLLGTILAFAI
jgi:hypothetical protein